MKITILNNIKIIEASEGYKLTFRNSTSNRFFSKIRAKLNFNEDNLLEVEDNNIPIQFPTIENNIVEKSTLAEMQQYIISQTKILLQEFLKDNPLFYNGKYYNVTSEAQTHLQIMIQAAENAENLNIGFIPTWGAIGEIRSQYSLNDLKKLLIEIQNYILPYIVQQQKMEIAISAISNKEELLTFNIAYQKVE